MLQFYNLQFWVPRGQTHASCQFFSLCFSTWQTNDKYLRNSYELIVAYNAFLKKNKTKQKPPCFFFQNEDNGLQPFAMKKNHDRANMLICSFGMHSVTLKNCSLITFLLYLSMTMISLCCLSTNLNAVKDKQGVCKMNPIFKLAVDDLQGK